MMKWMEIILDLLFPPKCAFCGRVLDRPGICPKCTEDLPWISEKEQVRKLQGGLRCAGLLWYEDLAREGLLRFKFRGMVGAAEPIGRLIAQCAAEHFGGEFDVVTWVPVSRKRLRQRGYDQAELLAESACKCWDTAPVRLLRKHTDTPAQSGMKDDAARRANVLGVYEAVGDAAGKRILLVDDICTTGATLMECARVLLAAGAEDVVCVTAALTRDNKGKKTTAASE